MGCFHRRVAVDFQHPLKAVHRFLRRCDLHLPAGGEYPAIEIAAEINGRLHSEVVLVHDLRGCILPEAVDDAVHEGVFAQQRNMARFAGKHGKFLCKIRRHIEILGLLKGSFLRDLQPVDAVYPELRNLLPVFVEAHEVVGIVIPEQGIWGDGIDFPAVSMHALLGGGIIEVAEGDFPSLCNSGLDAVYADVDALVDSFYAAVDVQMPFQQRGVSGSNKGRQPFDQILAFPRRDEPRRLHRVDEQLDLRGFKVPGCHMVEVLHSAFFDDIHAELHKLFNVAAERARVGGDLMLLQKRRNVRKGHRMGFVRGLPEVFEYEECSVGQHMLILFFRVHYEQFLHSVTSLFMVFYGKDCISFSHFSIVSTRLLIICLASICFASFSRIYKSSNNL